MSCFNILQQFFKGNPNVTNSLLSYDDKWFFQSTIYNILHWSYNFNNTAFGTYIDQINVIKLFFWERLKKQQPKILIGLTCGLIEISLTDAPTQHYIFKAIEFSVFEINFRWVWCNYNEISNLLFSTLVLVIVDS